MTKQIDTESFLQVLEDHKGILYKVANSYCKNEGHREDLIQEIILQLWRSYSNYDSKYKLSTWIYRIALNVSISFYRKEQKRVRINKDISENIITIGNTGEEIGNLELDYLKKFIDELKPLDKALMLLFLEDKSHTEIAEILGVSVSNVGTKINRIKKRLKIKFEHIKINENE